MVAWFLIAIATLAIFGYIAVSGVQNMATTSDGVGRIETVRRMDAAVNGLIARMAPAAGNSIMYLPAGQDNGAGLGYGLPANLAAQGQTPFGQKFVYCPFGDTGVGGTTINITNANNTTYMVRTAVYEGKTYVVGNRPYTQLSVNPNIMGWLLAPRSKLSPVPSCDQVTYNASTSKFEVPDGIVKVISRDAGIDEARTVSSRELTYYVSPSGTGSGASAGDPSSLATAVGVYRSRLPAKMTIYMATGSYSISPSLLDTWGLPSTELRIAATSSGLNNVNIDMASPGSISATGTLILDRINFDADTFVRVDAGRQLRLSNSQVGRIYNYGGTVSLTGTNTLVGNADWSSANLNGGRLDLGSSVLNIVSPTGLGIYARSSEIAGENATVNFMAAGAPYHYGFLLEDQASFGCQGCAINYNAAINDWGMLAHGKISLRGVTVRTNVNSPGHLIGLVHGDLALSYSNIGDGAGRVQWTVVDVGNTSQVSGNGSTVYKGTAGCWTGGIFQDSLSAAGSSSAVRPDDPIPALAGDPPSRADVQAYTDARSVNARRAALRQLNSSGWTCTP